MSFSDGGHWYTRDGESCHEVPDPDNPDQMIKTTLKHARVLNLGPSVTTIQGGENRPAINRWGNDKSALEGAAQEHLLGRMPERQWLNMVRSKAFAPVEGAAIAGEQYHLVAESITNNTELPDYELDIPEEFFGGFCEWWESSGLTAITTEASFAHPLGYGGRMDLVARDAEGRHVFADYKTKDTKGKTKSRLFFKNDHPVQLMAYRKGYEHTGWPFAFRRTPLLLTVIISRDEPGRIEWKYWPEEDHDGYWEKFKALLTIWKINNNYDPGWGEQ
jgi:hypothetical protein